jgi:hypothetical protein
MSNKTFLFYNINDKNILINTSIEIKTHKLKKGKVVFNFRKTNDEKLNEWTGHYANIIYNNKNKKSQLYYPVNIKDKQVTSYAEYDNNKEKFNRYNNENNNNIVMDQEERVSHNFKVFIDPQDKDYSYKGIGGIHLRDFKKKKDFIKLPNFLYNDRNVKHEFGSEYAYFSPNDVHDLKKLNGLYLYKSKDGIEWELANNLPIASSISKVAKKTKQGILAFDTSPSVVFDDNTNKYYLYTRANYAEDIRFIMSAESTDLINWSEFDIIKTNPTPFIPTMQNYYSPYTFKYPNSNYHISFPTYFECTPRQNRLTHNGCIKIGFCNSLIDFRDWTFIDNKLFYRDKAIKNDQDIRYRYDMVGFIDNTDNKDTTNFELYIHENVGTLNNVIRKYEIRRDGFSSLYSKDGYIIFNNNEFNINSDNINNIKINYQCIDEDSYIKIILIDNLTNNIIKETNNIKGDKVDKLLKWNTDYIINNINEEKCKNIYIKILLKNTHLYSIII